MLDIPWLLFRQSSKFDICKILKIPRLVFETVQSRGSQKLYRVGDAVELP